MDDALYETVKNMAGREGIKPSLYMALEANRIHMLRPINLGGEDRI